MNFSFLNAAAFLPCSILDNLESCSSIPFNDKNNLLEHAAHSAFVFKETFCVTPLVRICTSLFQSG
jgi:hypothetical protein